MEEDRDCLACEHSMFTDNENKMYCTLHKKTVDEEDTCKDFKKII